MRKALQELKKTGDYTGMTQDEWVAARKDVGNPDRPRRALPHRTRNRRENVLRQEKQEEIV
jgi:hypothetical protein